MKILSALFVVLSLSAVSGEFYPLSCDVDEPVNYFPNTSMKSWEMDACTVIVNPLERASCLKKITNGSYIPANSDHSIQAQKLYCQSQDSVSIARCTLVILKGVACPDFGVKSTVKECSEKESPKEQIKCAVDYLAQWQEEES